MREQWQKTYSKPKRKKQETRIRRNGFSSETQWFAFKTNPKGQRLITPHGIGVPEPFQMHSSLLTYVGFDVFLVFLYCYLFFLLCNSCFIWFVCSSVISVSFVVVYFSSLSPFSFSLLFLFFVILVSTFLFFFSGPYFRYILNFFISLSSRFRFPLNLIFYLTFPLFHFLLHLLLSSSPSLSHLLFQKPFQ